MKRLFICILVMAVIFLSFFAYFMSERCESAPAPQTSSGLEYIGENKEGYKEYRNLKDGAVMILIPAGEFLMGSSDGEIREAVQVSKNAGFATREEWTNAEKPQHKVYLDSYYIYKNEVTNEQFEKFVNETGYKTDAEKEGWGWVYESDQWLKVDGVTWKYFYGAGKERHPVIMVSWNDAIAYCKWAGLRLPTEAEWEKSARGADGRIFPWGNEWDQNKCNNWKGPKLSGMLNFLEGRGTLPVGSFPEGASPYGAMDMAGNVSQWCADSYDENYYKNSPYNNPEGPSGGNSRVSRGGSWFTGNPYGLRTASRNRNDPALRFFCYGFRCASGMK